MWQLIKAELSYQKMVLLAAGGCFLGLLGFLSYSPVLLFLPEIPFPRRVNIIYWFLFYLAFIILFNVAFSPFGLIRREKRNRLLHLLPVTVRQLGVRRMVLLSLIWMVMVAIYLLFMLAAGEWGMFWSGSEWPQLLVSLTGAFWTGSAYVMAMEDLQTLFVRERTILRVSLRRIFNVFVVLSTVLYFLAICGAIAHLSAQMPLTFEMLLPLLGSLARSWQGASIFLLTGAGLMLASIRTFELRKSFLE